MITLKTKIINIFDEKSKKIFLNQEELIGKLEDLIIEYELMDNYGYIECPNCRSDKLIRYGTYERNVGIMGNYRKIKIKRVKCKECGKTHALIPSFIIPYYQNERSFILLGISRRLLDNVGVIELSKELEISRQEIYSLVKRFKSHLTRLKTTFRSSLDSIMTTFLGDIENMIKYELVNGIRFMERVAT